MLKPLTSKEKENCRAYDKLYIDTQSFIRVRFLNSSKKAIDSKQEIGEAVRIITEQAIETFFTPYI